MKIMRLFCNNNECQIVGKMPMILDLCENQRSNPTPSGRASGFSIEKDIGDMSMVLRPVLIGTTEHVLMFCTQV